MQVIQIRGEAAERLEALAAYYGTDEDTAAEIAITDEAFLPANVFEGVFTDLTEAHELEVSAEDTEAFYRVISDEELDHLEGAAKYTISHQPAPDGGEHTKKELDKITAEKARREKIKAPF